jgi:ribosomal protein S18 acetylase RimI-like enzyme
VTSGPLFRLAQEADADLILEFVREYYAFDGHHFDEENSPAAVMGLLRDDSLGCVWLIQDGDAAVGYVVLTLGYSLELLGRDAFIDEFYLRETYRGRGWGRQAVAFVEDAARSLGVNSIHLEVTRPNTTAHRIYRKLGFEDRQHHLMTKWTARGLSKPIRHVPTRLDRVPE